MRELVLCLFALSFFLVSCGQGKTNESSAAKIKDTSIASATVYDSTFIKGKVIDSIISNKMGDETYALYLPSSYSSNKKFPCIVFFDAHARGALPLRLYKDLAEKYGFVLIGSNVSKNGMPWGVVHNATLVMMQYAFSHINIDQKRIYMAGFSGGSRVASSFAIQDGGVAGVIGIGAGFPKLENPFQNKFDYCGIVGNFDFNRTEMKELDVMLEQNGFTHNFITYDGKHDWATPSAFETALLWLQINAIKENLQPQNDTLIAEYRSNNDNLIKSATVSNDLITKYWLLESVLKTIDGLTDATSYKKQLDEINETHFKESIAEMTELQKKELTTQQEFVKQFTTQDEKWWTSKIAELNKNIHNAKTKLESSSDKRLLNYLGLVAYMNSNHALINGDLIHANTYLKIFKLADPQNPDCYYLSAIYYMKKVLQKEALTSLKQAVSLGYSDVAQLSIEPAFNSLHEDEGFEIIVDKVRGNRLK